MYTQKPNFVLGLRSTSQYGFGRCRRDRYHCGNWWRNLRRNIQNNQTQHSDAVCSRGRSNPGLSAATGRSLSLILVAFYFKLTVNQYIFYSLSLFSCIFLQLSGQTNLIGRYASDSPMHTIDTLIWKIWSLK